MDFDVGLAGAFIGGLLSFVSPCVLPLVPPYLCYLAGVSVDQFKGDEIAPGAGARVFRSALAFVIGFTVIFVSFGASATVLGKLVQNHLQWLSIAAGLVIIIMGLHFLGVFRLAILYREARVNVTRKPVGMAGAFVMGLAFAFGWTPCVGPVLAAILVTAGGQDEIGQGVQLLTAYSLGIGLPFLLAAAFAKPFMNFMRHFSKYLGAVEKVMGVLLVATGVLFMTGGMNKIAFWMLEYMPSLGRVG